MSKRNISVAKLAHKFKNSIQNKIMAILNETILRMVKQVEFSEGGCLHIILPLYTDCSYCNNRSCDVYLSLVYSLSTPQIDQQISGGFDFPHFKAVHALYTYQLAQLTHGHNTQQKNHWQTILPFHNLQVSGICGAINA